ncbi:DUF2637 domain-containing protein [Actinoplanes sp. RD1]|uniref:DUF2637 domain-containing protein n=1 Tax=Actinoplanes sp. RD1 TaxID=3064538 RepID=UPI0027406BB7|nr:DUF2637 domain-containing protein [Actinoplanes sp. RD1]
MILPRLRRVRWAVRATLVLGVAASVMANILHALDNPISQAIAAWPPLALLLTVELISRVPVHRRSLAVARFAATATIAGIAAWVSYWHMVGVAARYGETGASPYLLPLSVDGLIVVASICLVELGGRIATLERDEAAPATAVPVSAAPPTAEPAAAPPAKTPAAKTPAAEKAVAKKAPATEKPISLTAVHSVVRPAPRTKPRNDRTASAAAGGKPRRTPAETLAEARRIRTAQPDVTEAQLAKELGISASRWRQIRRDAEDATDLTLAA